MGSSASPCCCSSARQATWSLQHRAGPSRPAGTQATVTAARCICFMSCSLEKRKRCLQGRSCSPHRSPLLCSLGTVAQEPASAPEGWSLGTPTPLAPQSETHGSAPARLTSRSFTDGFAAIANLARERLGLVSKLDYRGISDDNASDTVAQWHKVSHKKPEYHHRLCDNLT